MPDKYEFRRYADNLTHPWFKDIQSDFKSLFNSPNRLLLCILCIILMNIDESTLFEHFGPDYEYDNYHNDNKDRTQPGNKTLIDANKIALFNAYELIIDESSPNHRDKQCNKMPINNYLGSTKKNIFHTQLMIGVMFGFMMNCRLPILFTFINIIIRSGCSFKPKIIPMFIDRKALKPSSFYGSSFKLLNSKEKVSYKYLQQDLNYYDSSSSDEDEEEDNDIDNELNYDLMNDELPKQLFSDQ